MKPHHTRTFAMAFTLVSVWVLPREPELVGQDQQDVRTLVHGTGTIRAMMRKGKRLTGRVLRFLCGEWARYVASPRLCGNAQ